MSLRLKIWGCRGSVPTPGPNTVTYGGNTSCVELDLGGDTGIVLDAGTGIRGLGVDLVERGVRRIHLLLTHLHLDHVEGLRFFAPLWDERVELDLWGPRSTLSGLRDRLLRAFSPPLFPIDLRDVPARVRFHDLPGEPLRVDGVVIASSLVLHPGPTLGYRVETGQSTVAYLPDHEPRLAGITGKHVEWISGGAIAHGADVVLHDAQYAERDYETKIGWGHSSVADAVAFSRAVDAGRLVLFHHEPSYSDHALEELEQRAADLMGDGPRPVLAREGMILELT
ncbi:MAG TPA: MBL fold metallo-hydrolase [Gaiellaceae bacterium]|nr:MBL fold metallo-hydrolase [Gaiellaceae bacterium]